MKVNFGIRKKIILFSTACLSAVFLWYMFLYSPKNAELKRIKDDLKSIQAQHELFLKRDAFQPSSILPEQEATIYEKYNELTAKIPERDYIPSAMIQMIKTGEGRNIRIVSVKPVTSQLFANPRLVGESQLKEVPVDIVLEGRFTDIGRYLFDLMDLPFFSGYNNIRMEESEEIYPKIKANIKCVLLFLNTDHENPE